MSTQQAERVPEITLGWRMKIAQGDMKREDIARELDVSPSTISRWLSDKGEPPRKIYIREWARITGYSLRWIETGEAPVPNPGPGIGDREDNLRRLADRKRRGNPAPETHTREYMAA